MQESRRRNSIVKTALSVPLRETVQEGYILVKYLITLVASKKE
jgi:hypothetical protein